MIWMKGREPAWFLSEDPLTLARGALAEIEAQMPACSDAAIEAGKGRWRDHFRALQAVARVSLNRLEEMERKAI